MTCHYCRYSNSGDEHRCRRCGRRLDAEAWANDAAARPQASGANALAPQAMRPAPRAAAELATDASIATLAEPAPRAAQTSLFGADAENVIPFAVVRKLMTALAPPQPLVDLDETLEMRRPVVTPEIEQKKTPRKTRSAPPVENLQTALDFHPSATQSARMLKTTVEAVIYCDAPVAHPLHRVLAGALDFSIIALAAGIFAATFHFLGGSVVWNKVTLLLALGALGAIALFYGLLWTIAGRASAGMRTMQLKLINFDGLPPDTRSRVVRMLGTILSFGSGGLGIIWALVDEEDLAWHDHMSKTFPTLDEGRVYLRAQKL